MNEDVLYVHALPEFRLQVKFADGAMGIADLRSIVESHPAYVSLKDPTAFARVFVHPELKAVCWPGGIDIAPETLRHLATGEPYPDWMKAETRVGENV